jgi:phosphoadenosine phosphosulfate reductase
MSVETLETPMVGEDAPPEQIVAWMLDHFADRNLVLTTSFGMEGCALIDMVARHGGTIPVIYLDTKFLFPETYRLRDIMVARYPQLRFENRGSSLSPDQQAAQYGPELWRRNADACCRLRKVEPMRQALSSVDCWVAGVRRADSSSRSKTPKFGWDKRFDLWKLNPLADWTERDVWNYIREHHLPYNPLHDHGYPSIGCTHCTQPVEPGGDLRAGRWTGLAKTECGIN